MAEIGESLREARMRARIDISEVEARTKIRAKYLRALENEEWNLVPGPVYVKSFLKTYGDYLGLDSRLLIDEFKRRYERPSENEVRASASSARERDRSPSRLVGTLFSPIGVIVVALIVIVVALYLIGSHSGNSASGLTGTITPSNGAGGGATTKKHKPRSARHKKAGAGNSTTGTRTSTSATSDTTTTARTSATLAMVPTGDTWVCVENASGTTLYTGTYRAGETIRTVRSSALLVSLGNNEVRLTVNGKPYTPAGTAAIGFKITPSGVTNLTTHPVC
jgi:cytoskeletal protein RodZ